MRDARMTGSLVGLDVGTSGVKAIAITPDGEVLARAERGYPLAIPRPGWAEQDPEDWWRAAEAALAELGRDDVLGIGLSGQMHGLVAVDEAGDVIRPAILWNDQRTAAECAEIEKTVGLERLVSLTGNRALAGFTAPKLLWLRHNEPESYERIRFVLLPKDYVRFRLTGERVMEVSDASGSLLLDVAARRWSDDVLSALDIPSIWLSPLLESQDVAGYTPRGTPVAAGAGDQAAAALGVGVVGPGPLSVVLGTSGVVLAVLPEYACDPLARVHAFCHAAPGSWLVMGVMLSAAGSLRWFRDALAVTAGYDELLAEAARWEPGVEGLLFAPYLAGERTPHADPDARGAFVGLELRHDRGALVRALLEGVAFGLRDSLELLGALGVARDRGRASGGGARGRLWLEIVASVLRLPLELTAVEEGSAYGAAILGGVAAGVFGDVREGVARCVHIRETIEPNPRWVERYQTLYERYTELYAALEPFERPGL